MSFLLCLALHNFIHNSNLNDMEFNRCDVDEYSVEQVSGTKQTQRDENPDMENEDTMNTIRGRTHQEKKILISLCLVFIQ